MKKVILLLLCTYSLQLAAQSFSISVINDTTYCSPENEIGHAHYDVVNEGAGTLELDIIREIVYTLPDWVTAMCFDTICYYSVTDSIRVPIAEGSDALFRSGFILMNDTTSNVAVVKYLFRNVNDPDDQTELFTYALNENVITSISALIPEKELSIYPNPFKEELFLETDLMVESIVVLNIHGQQIAQAMSTDQLGLNHLPKGIYFLKISTEKGIVVRQVFKE